MGQLLALERAVLLYKLVGNLHCQSQDSQSQDSSVRAAAQVSCHCCYSSIHVGRSDKSASLHEVPALCVTCSPVTSFPPTPFSARLHRSPSPCG